MLHRILIFRYVLESETKGSETMCQEWHNV